MAEEVKAQEEPVSVPSDQWKRGGICAACRRKEYCKKRCRANKEYASLRIREYIRRRFGINQIYDTIHNVGGDAE